ncbi:MAG: caspase family protein [Chitinophagales bacterium]
MKKGYILLLLCSLALQYSYCGVGSLDGYPSVKRKALLIAISDYDEISGFGKLSCGRDIELLQQSLKLIGFKNEDVQLLIDSQATKKNIIKSLNDLVLNAKSGDVIFVHYSGHGIQLEDDNGDETDRLDEAIVPIDVPNFKNKDKFSEACIRDDEIAQLLNQLRLKIGCYGQIIFSADASHMGQDEPGEIKHNSTTANGPQFTRGGIADELQAYGNLNKNRPLTPLIMFSPCLNKELGFETVDDEGKGVGLFSYAFYKAITESVRLRDTAVRYNAPLFEDYADFYYSIKHIIRERHDRQTPTITGDINQPFFAPIKCESGENSDLIKKQGDSKSLQGNCYLVSIGISNYTFTKGSFEFKNCVKDAKSFSGFIQKQFNAKKESGKEITSCLLTNESATADAIIDSLNSVINRAKPNDYFIFNFAGYSWTGHDSTGRELTFFAPYGIKDISDTSEIKAKGISLTKLKNLLEFIPANNQLFITEAGPTPNFSREFVKALIESAPDIASLSKRNRIIIVPAAAGLDHYQCDGNWIESGPLNSFITSLPDEENIFRLFGDAAESARVERLIVKKEMDCNFTGTTYTKFFYERRFISDMQFYMNEQGMKNRGAALINEDIRSAKQHIKKKVALVVGSDTYSGKPQWTDLPNPVRDAKAIAEELSTDYGFAVTLLTNSSQDSIYRVLLTYAQSLDTSDQLMIVFCGHGDYDDRYFDDGFVVLSGSQTTKADPYRKSYIPFTNLAKLINNLPPKQILVLLDVCFGGTFDANLAKYAKRDAAETAEDMESEVFISKKLKYKTRIVLTSGGKNVVPDGYAGKHSPFASNVLAALRTLGDKNHLLLASDIFKYVQKLPSEPHLGSFGDDEPGSEFILIAQP